MEAWTSGIDEDEFSDVSRPSTSAAHSDLDSDTEMPYENAPRKRRPSWDEDKKRSEVQSLPIKLADGKVQMTGVKAGVAFADSDTTSESEEDEIIPEPEPRRTEDVSTGARFGRPAVVDILTTKSRKARVEAAKEQIAGICQDIVADPENSVRLSSPCCAAAEISQVGPFEAIAHLFIGHSYLALTSKSSRN
jgi:nucleolar complex protein 3